MRSLETPTSLVEIGFKGGSERIMSTDMIGFQSNFTLTLEDEDVKRIIDHIDM
jgi:hypothetical protein